MLQIEIDGKQIAVKQGETVMEASVGCMPLVRTRCLNLKPNKTACVAEPHTLQRVDVLHGTNNKRLEKQNTNIRPSEKLDVILQALSAACKNKMPA